MGLILLAVFSGFFFNSRERSLRSDAEKKLGESLKQNGELENSLSLAMQEKTDLQTRLQEAENRLVAFSEKLVKADDQLSKIRSNRHKMWLSYKNMVLRRHALELELRGKDDQIQRILEDLDTAMRDRPVDLGAVVVPVGVAGDSKPRRKGASANLPEGKVMVINEDSEFVVVDLGSERGIRQGTELLISREGDPLGAAKVEMVQGTLSAATVSKASARKIRAGDTARVMEL